MTFTRALAFENGRRIRQLLRQPRFLAWLGLVLFVAWLRLRYLGYTEIWHDQARTLNMALEWVHGGPLPLASDLTSMGVHNAPLSLYLYGLALAVTPSLLGVVWLIALLNLVGILAVGAATSRVFGWRAGWWAALLFAVAPWAVYYGRLIWMVSFVPAFAAGAYACLLLYLTVDQKPGYLVGGLLLYAATVQTHLTALTLLPALFIAGVVLWRRLRWRPLALGALLAAATFVPFIAFQVRSGFADLDAARSGLEGRLDINLTALELALDLFRSRTIYDTVGNLAGQWRGLVPAAAPADRLAVLWLAAGFAVAAVSSIGLARKPEPRAAAGLLLALWVSLPILPFIPHTRIVNNYYFLHILPAGPVLMASLSEGLARRLDSLLSRWPGAARAAAALAFAPLALIAAAHALVDVAGQNLLATGAYGQQRIVDTEAAIDTARRLMAARPDADLVVISEVPLWADTRFGLMREFVDPRRVKFADGHVFIYPYPSAVYFLALDDAGYASRLGAVAVPLPEATIRTPSQTWTFYDLPAGKRVEALPPEASAPALAKWANGLELRSFTIEGGLDASELKLTCLWQVGAGIPPGLAQAPHSLRFTNQLLSQDGRLVAQADGVTSDSRDWQPGDVLERVWTLAVPPDLPPGTYRLATGVYSLPDVARVPLCEPPGDLFYLATLAK